MEMKNCIFKFECEQQWSDLTEIRDQRVRFCEVCESDVHLCETNDEIARAIREDLCVAIATPAEMAKATGPADPTAGEHVEGDGLVVGLPNWFSDAFDSE